MQSEDVGQSSGSDKLTLRTFLRVLDVRTFNAIGERG